MYRLTVEFKSREELIAFLLTQGEVKGLSAIQSTENKYETPPPYTLKTPSKEEKQENNAKKAAKKEKPVTQEAPAVEVQSQPTAAVNEPVVQPEVRTPAPVTAIDRAALIAKATQLVQALKATGLADDQLMPKIHEVYAQANCPLNLKISQLEDSQLSIFIPLFDKQVASIVASKKENAFI